MLELSFPSAATRESSECKKQIFCNFAESRLRPSKAAMELAHLQYINGVIGYLDVLDAQRSYFDAQIGLSNAIRDKQITMVKMYKALGGGW